MTSDNVKPADRYRQRAARLRSLVADCDSPAIVQRLLAMAVEYEHLAKICEAAQSPAIESMQTRLIEQSTR
ncbi:MAG TPA: hypothetical protein VFW28_16560 [Micropepsaceae bacterium]|nr:hypothetical protein [Micropepsaceae bacterium]